MWPNYCKRLVLSLILTAITFSTVGYSKTNSATGMRSAEERELLWKSGHQAFAEGNWEQAAYYLQRYVDRYSSAKYVQEARILLGNIYLSKKSFEEAQNNLKEFIDSDSRSLESYRARILLGRAFWGTKQFSESLQVSYEILQPKTLPLELQLEGLLVKAWATIGLDKDKRAQLALSDFDQKIGRSTQSFDELLSERKHLAIELKARSCARLPSQRRMDELTAKREIKRRGICLSESLVIFKNLLELKQEKWAILAKKRLIRAYRNYARACDSPPLPVDQRSKIQTQRYLNELKIALLQECENEKRSALLLIDSWRNQVKEGWLYHLNSLSKEISQS